MIKIKFLRIAFAEKKQILIPRVLIIYKNVSGKIYCGLKINVK